MKNFCASCWIKRASIKFFAILLVAGKIQCQDFGYNGDKGPTHWGEQYNTCYGKHQSPINIDSLDVVPVNLPPLEFIGFDEKPAKTKITNNGHTVMLEADCDPQPAITGGPLNGLYEFTQLHFHWGENDTIGSEDLIDNHSFAMELHVVMYKSFYRSSREALHHEDGLVVLAFFIEVSPTDNPAFTDFTETLKKVTSPHTHTSFDELQSLRQLIGEDLTQYYTYNGSLTTPPCSEVVVWIDFKEPITLSHNQIEKFRALEDTEGAKMTHNFRPIQPLGDRVVLFNTGEIEGNDLNRRKWVPYDVVQTHEDRTTAKADQDDLEANIPDREFTEPSNDLASVTESSKRSFKRLFRKNSAWKHHANSCLLVAIYLLLLCNSARV